jgi:hypothetical protein
MSVFREVLDFCNIRDIGFSGVPWTYDNRKEGARNVKVRLDRGVATQEWINCFFMLLLLTLPPPVQIIAPFYFRCKRRNLAICMG